MSEETPKLTRKQQLFIDYYLQSFNASEAARLAGYSEKTAHATGWENLRKPAVKNVVEKAVDARHSVSISSEWRRIIERSKNTTFVYLICAENGLTKIGISQDVKKRLLILNTASPVDLRLTFSFQSLDAKATEKSLHTRYHNKRVKGEWFDLSKDEIGWIIKNHETI